MVVPMGQVAIVASADVEGDKCEHMVRETTLRHAFVCLDIRTDKFIVP